MEMIVSFLLKYGTEITMAVLALFGYYQHTTKKKVKKENEDLKTEVIKEQKTRKTVEKVAKEIVKGQEGADEKIKKAVTAAKLDRSKYFN